ncbi:MAG: putative metalloprotease with PDZ domain, partial [Crocinitomicaceae bacterium]
MLVLVLTFFSFGQEIKYNLKMTKPQNHYFQVEMELSNFDQEEIMVKMPIWSPGSYLAREFAKNVDLVVATDEDGGVLPVKKISKNTWKITKAKG